MKEQKEKNFKNKKNGNWRDFGIVLKRSNLPWVWIIIAFCVSLANNQLLLWLPNTTTSLFQGDLQGKALIDAVIFFIIVGLMSCAATVTKAQATVLSVRRARVNLWNKMMKVKVSFYDKNDPADLMSAITTDVSSGFKNTILIMIEILPSLYYIVGALLQIRQYHWLLTVVILAFLPFRYLYALFVGGLNYRLNLKAYTEIGGLTGFLAERIRNLSLIKTYTNEKIELQNGHVASERIRKANMKLALLSCLIQGLEIILRFGQEIVTLIVAVILLQQGKIDISQWVAFFLFTTTLSNYFGSLISEWFFIKMAHGAMARAAGIYQAPEEDVDAIGKSTIPETGLDLEFDNVTFSYDDKPALHGVSFKIPQGSSTAIVGLCGSGKTTSLALIEQFYHTNEGEVRYGGIPVQDFTLGDYRKNFSYVQQRPEVFSGTVREAMTYGIDRQTTDDELMNAARQSGFMTYLELQPAGLDTPVAAAGTSMSGGQLQRLVLAREFLRNSNVLLLDEPTSALDTESAKAVQETIFSMFTGKTIVMVTHDLHLVQKVDQIIVLQEGELVGRGKFNELMNDCPLFHDMVDTQLKEEAQQGW